MYKGAVFFDYDGTIIDQSAGIVQATPKTLESFQKLKENGYLTVLCSGRSMAHVPPIDFEFDCYITANGGCVSAQNKPFFSNPMDISNLKKTIQFCEQHGITYYLERFEYSLVGGADKTHIFDVCKQYNIPPETFRLITKDSSLEDIVKIVINVTDLTVADRFKQAFMEELDVFSQIDPYSFDVAKKGCSKATGIEKVIQRYDIALANTYAFGDGGNDYDMIKFVGHGIVIKKHDPILDTIGDFYTETVKNEGITVGLQHYGLV